MAGEGGLIPSDRWGKSHDVGKLLLQTSFNAELAAGVGVMRNPIQAA